jgi:type IV pilus assembly protein PilW
MNPKHKQSLAARRIANRGFTLVEIMIAILIGLFLTGGLLTLVQAMKRTSVTQNGLSQLQDNERMAMTLLTDVIQSAGYFPKPTVNTAASLMPVTGAFTFAGQSIVGTGKWLDPSPGNSITVRYVTWGTGSGHNDQTINCTGNTAAVQTLFTNTFSLAAGTVLGTYDLVCVLNGAAAVHLVSGVKNLQIYYGVQTNPAVSNNSADTYLDANTVTAWNKVISVKVTLTFVNPMYGSLAGQTLSAPQTIAFTRVVAVMNKTGVTT